MDSRPVEGDENPQTPSQRITSCEITLVDQPRWWEPLAFAGPPRLMIAEGTEIVYPLRVRGVEPTIFVPLRLGGVHRGDLIFNLVQWNPRYIETGALNIRRGCRFWVGRSVTDFTCPIERRVLQVHIPCPFDHVRAVADLDAIRLELLTEHQLRTEQGGTRPRNPGD